MIRSVNELFAKLNLTEEEVVRLSKANNAPKWKMNTSGFQNVDDSAGAEATLSIEDGFLEGVVTEFNKDETRDVVFFVFDLTESVPVLAEGVLHDAPCTNQHAMFGEFARQVSMMGTQTHASA